MAMLIAVAALALGQAVLVGWAALSAGEAARVGARAAHVGVDPVPASQRAVHPILGQPVVSEGSGRVRVTVSAPNLFPGMAAIPVSATTSLDPLAVRR